MKKKWVSIFVFGFFWYIFSYSAWMEKAEAVSWESAQNGKDVLELISSASNSSEYDNAIWVYSNRIAINPKDTVAYAARSVVYLKRSGIEYIWSDKNRASIDNYLYLLKLDLETATELNSQDENLNLAIARVYKLIVERSFFQVSDYARFLWLEKSLAMYTKTIEKNPQNLDTHVERIQTYQVYKKIAKDLSLRDIYEMDKQLLVYYTKLAENHPEYPYVHYWLATAYYNYHYKTQALKEFEIVLGLDFGRDTEQFHREARRCIDILT